MTVDYRVFAAPDSIKLHELFENARAFVSKVEELTALPS
jgi:hypothetical protein